MTTRLPAWIITLNPPQGASKDARANPGRGRHYFGALVIINERDCLGVHGVARENKAVRRGAGSAIAVRKRRLAFMSSVPGALRGAENKGEVGRTGAEIEIFFTPPFSELIQCAQTGYRGHFDADAAQWLLSIKTGGCPEDCPYRPRPARRPTGVENKAVLPFDPVLVAAWADKWDYAHRR